jgi:hypothetical protein
MSIKTNITDPSNGRAVSVSSDGSLKSQISPYPPQDSSELQTVFRRYMTLNDDGTTIDMIVDGSTTPQEFVISADPDKDTYITSISWVLTDPGAVLNDFGALTALTNGCRLYYEDNNGIVDMATEITTNFEFIRFCQGTPSFADVKGGVGGGSFIAYNIDSANAEGIIPVLDIKRVFGLTYGIKLLAGTTQKLVFEINDDLAGLSQFDAIVYGNQIKYD